MKQTTPPLRRLSDVYEDRLADFFSQVAKRTDEECWEWTGRIDRHGYGRASVAPPGGSRSTGPHRLAYLIEHGSIPADMVVDHLCRNRLCCNPAHLEAVTNQVNLQRGKPGRRVREACRRGHPFTPENTITLKRYRLCRTCRDARLALKRNAT